MAGLDGLSTDDVASYVLLIIPARYCSNEKSFELFFLPLFLLKQRRQLALSHLNGISIR